MAVRQGPLEDLVAEGMWRCWHSASHGTCAGMKVCLTLDRIDE